MIERMDKNMKNEKTFFYHRLLFYILGLLIMSVGSNLFLKATLGVAPSCTMALTLSYLSPVHSYALFNFLINSTFLICEAVVLREFGKIQFIQLGLTFVYSLFIEFTSYGYSLSSLMVLQQRSYYLLLHVQFYLQVLDLQLVLDLLLCQWKVLLRVTLRRKM